MLYNFVLFLLQSKHVLVSFRAITFTCCVILLIQIFSNSCVVYMCHGCYCFLTVLYWGCIINKYLSYFTSYCRKTKNYIPLFDFFLCVHCAKVGSTFAYLYSWGCSLTEVELGARLWCHVHSTDLRLKF